MEGCTNVKIPPIPVNMKSKKEVEKYQVRLFKAAGKPVSEYLKKSMQDRKEREVSICDTFTKIKRLFRQSSFNHVKQGIELTGSSGDPVLFDSLLEGISYSELYEEKAHFQYDKGAYYILLSKVGLGYKVGKFEKNNVFKETKADFPYFIQAVLGLISYAPPGCKPAKRLKEEITGWSIILPEDPDEPYIDLQGSSLLAGFKNLEYLELINCGSLTDLGGLSGLKRLNYLLFKDCRKLKVIECLNGLPNLVKVDLSGCSSLENVDGLAGSNKIESIILNGCKSLKNLDGLKGLRDLNKISLSGCNSLNNLDGLQGIRKITIISINNCGSLENLDALKGINSGIKFKIDLTGCAKLMDVKGLKRLKGLNSLGINDIRYENLDNISEQTQLREIDLSSSTGSSKLKDLSALNKMTQLYWLDLKGSVELETLQGLEKCKSLKIINLVNCKKLKNIDALLGLPDLEQILLRGSGVKRDSCPVQLLYISDWRSADFW